MLHKQADLRETIDKKDSIKYNVSDIRKFKHSLAPSITFSFLWMCSLYTKYSH